MEKIEYLYDDIGASNAFVLSLKLRVIRERFSSPQDWNPGNCAPELLEGKPIALADRDLSDDAV
ncbi:hypothetical protein G6M16_024285 (plasmid) [Agrobacterium tumefaciens]|nr:hypothetical protein G6M16_024285 [Agrobacterium tumefaciens]